MTGGPQGIRWIVLTAGQQPNSQSIESEVCSSEGECINFLAAVGMVGLKINNLSESEYSQHLKNNLHVAACEQKI